MSSFQKKHDDSLIASPWRFKADNNEQTWLFKHAPHPDKAGYLLIATDLNSILFESLTASSIPSRLAALADISPSQRPNTSHSTSDTDVENIASMIEDTLDKIGGLMGDWWDEVTLQIRDDDFYDRIMLLSTEDFTWSFNLTELRDRTPLTFISRHLIQPLSSLLATSYNTKIPHGCSSVNTLARLLSQEGLAEEIATASKSGPSRSTKGKSPAKRARTKDPSPTISRHRVEDIKKEDNGSPGPQTSSSEAVRTSRIATQASPTLKEDISSPTLTPEPTPSPTDTTPEPTPTPLGQSPRPARVSPDLGPEPKYQSREKSSTPTPPLPKSQSPIKIPPPPASQRPSQKSRKDKEQEEEEEMKKRLEAMKAKMGKGGGSKLGKRRLGR